MTSHCNTNGSVTGFGTRIAACTNAVADEGLLPVIVPTRVAPAQAIATHSVDDVAALDVTTAGQVAAGTCGLVSVASRCNR
jgi:hypothetical protein